MINSIRRYFARRRLQGRFGTYVSPATVERMVDAGETPALGRHEVELTAFFASVHQYVSLAEQVPLAQLPELMNSYFEACTSAIQEEGGTLDKYVGDAVVAMFGAPLAVSDHALRGCVAALRCQARVGELREQLRRDTHRWPELAGQLRVRVGLNSGQAIVGHMGSRTRFNYTMLGDDVNLAARLEAGAKHHHVWTLCSGQTRDACEQAKPGRVVFRRLSRIAVKGRAQPLELFEPVALREDATDRLRECIGIFEAGLARWSERDWADAIQQFEKSAPLERDQPRSSPEITHNPSTFYLKLAREFQTNPEARPPSI